MAPSAVTLVPTRTRISDRLRATELDQKADDTLSVQPIEINKLKC
jgi:hypothetical protein